jgi:phosphopantothenoylcysteine decarboxylase / phosphopantothenate---cysteine ligase
MKYLITAGPTREKIDPVRFFTNYSSGKMGYALAEAAKKLGNDVKLISGPTNLKIPAGIKFIQIESAAEMYSAVMAVYKNYDVIIMVAAVADYRPKEINNHKLKKKSGDLIISMERTEDILLELSKYVTDDQILVGFAAETDNVIEYAKGKLIKKNLDWIIANKVGSVNSGFTSDDNSVTMLSKHGDEIELALMSKKEIAENILKTIVK